MSTNQIAVSNTPKTTQVVGDINITNEVLMSEQKAKNFAGKICHDVLGLTLSLAYYSTIDKNIKSFKTSNKGLSTKLHSVFRQYISASYDDKTEMWKFDSKKAERIQKQLGVAVKTTTFEEFKIAMTAQVETKEAAKQEKIAEEEALSPTEVITKTQDRITAYLIKNMAELSKEQRADIMLQVNTELASK